MIVFILKKDIEHLLIPFYLYFLLYFQHSIRCLDIVAGFLLFLKTNSTPIKINKTIRPLSSQ